MGAENLGILNLNLAPFSLSARGPGLNKYYLQFPGLENQVFKLAFSFANFKKLSP